MPVRQGKSMKNVRMTQKFVVDATIPTKDKIDAAAFKAAKKVNSHGDTSAFERLKAKGDEFFAALLFPAGATESTHHRRHGSSGGGGEDSAKEPTHRRRGGGAVRGTTADARAADDGCEVDAQGKRARAVGAQDRRTKKRRQKEGEQVNGVAAAAATASAARPCGGATGEEEEEEGEDEEAEGSGAEDGHGGGGRGGTDKEEMLARLSAHGRAFMERLESEADVQLPPAPNRKQARRARSAAAVAPPPAPAPAAAGTPSSSSSSSSSQAEESGGSGDDEEAGYATGSEDMAEFETTGGSSGAREVVVVEAASSGSFDSGPPPPNEGRNAFLSSKISKISETAKRRPQTAAELKEDEEDRKNDAELMSILEATKLIEKYSAEQLTGKERRGWIAGQAVKLGMQAMPNAKKPLSLGLRLKKSLHERELKAVEDAKNVGLYHKSLKHAYPLAAGKPKVKGRPRKVGDRGLANAGVGRYRKGALHISEAEIKWVERSGKSGGKGKRIGGKRGSSAKKLVR